MIAELGLAALWLAAALAVLQLFAGAVVLKNGDGTLAALIRPVAVVQGALAAFAFGALLLLFAQTDLSVALVAANSHTAKPMIYKLSGTWGNHEGSMLLWITVMAVAGALIAVLERRLPERT
ncbi:MAG: heme lyase NrfEFG subunit NrfE, partial [Proteobacteria bacterium]